MILFSPYPSLILSTSYLTLALLLQVHSQKETKKNMALMAIWVDRENAKLFHFGSEQLTHKNFVARYPMHHTHAEGEVDHQRREHEFFKEFTPEMKDADQILIMGPGVAKHHFQTFLNEHHPAIAKKIVGCEAVDHPTEPQIIALARRFFSTEHFPT